MVGESAVLGLRPHPGRLGVWLTVALLGGAHASAQSRVTATAAAEVHSPAAQSGAAAEGSLQALVAYADRHSPLLAIARSTRSRAEALRIAAEIWLPDNPELSVALGARMGQARTGLDADIALVQPLQIAGERGRRIAAAARQRELTDAEIAELRWSLVCDLRATFHRALLEAERTRMAERIVAFQRDVLRIVERTISAGENAPVMLRLAQAEVAQSEQVVLQSRQGLWAARLHLAELSGWSVSAPPLPNAPIEPAREPPQQARLVSLARKHLPSLRAAAARVREARSRVDLADREAWPRPSLGVRYEHESDRGSEGSYDIWMGAVTLPLPVFARNQGARAAARADSSVAQAELAAAERLLEVQVAQARSEVVAAAERTRAYGTEIVPRFEENLALLRRSLELGEIDLLSLGVGRERFLKIQTDALSAQLDYFTAHDALERVIGVELGATEEDAP
jgi:cobalt-zinc-cadmium efflux system outer membrane protein